MGGVLRNPVWYWRRARSMTAPELVHRAGEQVRRTVSRYHRPEFVPEGEPDLRCFPGLAAGVVRLGAEPVVREQWRIAADELRHVSPRLLGRPWPNAGERERWHLDPVTGKLWPSDRYCFDIDYRHEANFGDIKYVWERSRLQYVQSAAAYAHVSGDAQAARSCIAELESWIDANPPFLGVNWASGIELAVRIVSFLVSYAILGPDAFPPALRRKMAKTLAAHGYWLMRFPSRFSSANNHLIAEASGLYLLGSLAPALPHASEYRRYGFETLTREALRQIHPDGVGAEQSLTYAASTVEWLLLCGELGGRLGEEFPAAYWDRIRRAGCFLASITDCRGNQPRFGDDDEGHVLDFRGIPSRYESSVLSGISKVVGVLGFTPGRGGEAHLLHALLPGECKSAPPRSGHRIFREGGYTVSRSQEGGREALLLFDHGPVGYLSIAAHGHADTLAIWLHLDGAPVLADGGTYLYHAGREWRSHFRGSAAHSTLTLNGQDSSVSAGHFGWQRHARARLVSVGGDGARWHVEAEHDGYENRFGVIHRRRLERAGPGRFVITDTILGNRADGEIGFLVHPGCHVQRRAEEWEVAVGNGSRLCISHRGPLQSSVAAGGEAPRRGWHSPAFGQKVAAPRITFAGKLIPGIPYQFVLEVGTAQTGVGDHREAVDAEQR